jgi:hypothetical protein
VTQVGFNLTLNALIHWFLMLLAEEARGDYGWLHGLWKCLTLPRHDGKVPRATGSMTGPL